jgi:hypothetical protein
MINDQYINFLGDTRRRDDEIKLANEHRIAKAIPVRRPAFITFFTRLYQRGLANLGGLLVDLGGRLKCHYENLLAANNSGAKTDPC